MSFRKVDSFFGAFLEHVINIENVSEDKLEGDDDYSELNRTYYTLTDGQIIEFCFWHESDIYMEDVSVSKNEFDKENNISFEEYMREKGLYTENIMTPTNEHWQYCGQQRTECKDYYRLQYYLILD